MNRRWKPGLAWPLGIVSLLVAVAAGTATGLLAQAGGDTDDGDKSESRQPEPAVKVDADEIENVTIDPGVADVDLRIAPNDVDVIVHNDFGRDIPGVLMKLDIEEPGDGFPKVGVHGGDESCDHAARGDGVSEAEARSECERLQKSGEEWCRPQVSFPEPGVQDSECLRTLHPGENRYLYDMGMWPEVDEVDDTRLRGFPELTVSVELSVDGEVFTKSESVIPSPWVP